MHRISNGVEKISLGSDVVIYFNGGEGGFQTLRNKKKQ